MPRAGRIDRLTGSRKPSGTTPELDCCFTEAAVWIFSADNVESGHEVESIVVHNPRGAAGYLLQTEPEAGHRPLCIRLQPGSDKSVARRLRSPSSG